MAGIAPTLDRRKVAALSDEEIDAFVRRVMEILRRAKPEDFDSFTDRIEALLDGADTVNDES